MRPSIPLIPTYNEPFEVLAPTVAAAIAVQYPHNTYVLDDGRRPWVKRICRRLGAKYLTRDSNQGAKAGNLNNAISVTHGEFVAIIDADFVPSPTYIDDMLGYFADQNVAFVQGPQEFYNRDSFQHLIDDPDNWHEQALFFRLIQLGKNGWNAAFWCGCPSLLRRRALESIGGVAAETITEDLHTSIRLHADGWKSVYHAGVVAVGIAPNDYSSFIMQRLRWAQGAMQVIRKEWKIPGLSIVQRINYAASSGTYFDALRKGIFLSVIPAVILSDQLPITADARTFLGVWLTQFLLSAWANVLQGRGHYRYMATEFFDLLKMWAFIRATRTLFFGRRLVFRVTPKGRSGERHVHAMLMPHVCLFGIYFGCLVLGFARLTGFGPFNTGNQVAMLAAVLWAVGVLGILTAVVSYGYRHVSQRQAERLQLSLTGTWRPKYGRIPRIATLRNLTTLGCSIRVTEPPPRNKAIHITLPSEGLALWGAVTNIQESEGGFLVGIRFALNERQASQLAALIARTIISRYTTTAPHQPEEVTEVTPLAA